LFYREKAQRKHALRLLKNLKIMKEVRVDIVEVEEE